MRYWWTAVAVGVTWACGSAAPIATVRPGLEVLLSDSLHLVRGVRVGLLTNQTGVGRDGTSNVEHLLDAGVTLTALFSPEHGFRGALDQSEIGHGVDSATGLPIYSLYGATRRPTAAMLTEVDRLVIDLQDIGARPYTYISTALLAMQAAVDRAIPVVVLDRPNPIGGAVQGPRMTVADTSFVGLLTVPQRHGMTIGELARWGNRELGIGADLRVVPVVGWDRRPWFDETALPWVRPSPNMPNLESATHYPGLVVFEATNLSVGRGTAIAFQVIAAPWLQPDRVRAAVGPVPGVAFADTVVRPVAPGDAKYDGLVLPALRLRVTDRGSYDPVRTALRLLAAIGAQPGGDLVVRWNRFYRLAGDRSVRDVVEGRLATDTRWPVWEREVAAFRTARTAALLYPDPPS